MVKVVVMKQPLVPDVLTVPQTAKKLKTKPENVYALIRMGKLKCLLLGQQSIPKFELQRFMNDNLGVDLRDDIQANIDEFQQNKQMA